MKISQMNTDQLADCMCIIAEPVERMMQDEKTLDIFRALNPGMPRLSIYGTLAGKLIPLLFKEHRNDLYIIVAALTGKKIEAVAKQNGLATLKDCKEVFDKDLIDFFKSAATPEPTE